MAAQGRKESDSATHAKALFRAWARGEQPLETAASLLELGGALVDERNFAYARRVLARVRTDDPTAKLLLAQQHALATYKDRELRTLDALERSLELLGDLAVCDDSETLGIAGAVYKRLWEVDGQRGQLELALACYERGYGAQQAPYPGINAAFVLDLLAEEEEKDAALVGVPPTRAEERRRKAQEIRTALVESDQVQAAADGDWWDAVTLVEAHLGLGQYQEAKRWATRAATLRANRTSQLVSWKLETTARQLSALARMRVKPGEAFEDSEAGAVVAELFPLAAGAVSSLAHGKVGLALSGGGFRASFFHIGVLAALAERDALRHVEVLSCVSGGSILGAHFYLKLKLLLEQRPDAAITHADYVQLVGELADEFVRGVQKNIRTRVAANPWTSLRTIIRGGFTRTQRNGELFEKILYSQIRDDAGLNGSERLMRDLKVDPKDHDGPFRPQDDNWVRAAKVPILVLNATTLNTGHNWQFTATWMGEPPAGADTAADRNDRLRRMYYDEAPGDYKNLRLGHAVAASASVPGLFEPIVFADLYEGLTLRLVDGGVYDNQGIGALLDQDCSVILVSDASGQMPTVPDVVGDPVGVAGRSNSVLMARVRCSQFADLQLRVRAGVLRGLMFVHLRQGLGARVRSWVSSTDPYDPLQLDSSEASTESFGIPPDVQSLLAKVRTDLDSFTDVEAYALMASGYRMTLHDLEQALQHLPEPTEAPPVWPFQPVLDVIDAGRTRELCRQLEVSRSRGLKLLKLMASRGPHDPDKPGRRKLTPLFRNAAYRVGSGVLIGTLGPILGGIHLGVVDRLFLARGRLDRLEKG